MATSITKPIEICIERITQLAEGDLKSPVPVVDSRDETGLLASTTTNIVGSINKIIVDMDDTLNELSKGNFKVESFYREEYLGDFKPLLVSVDKIISSASRGTKEINSTL